MQLPISADIPQSHSLPQTLTGDRLLTTKHVSEMIGGVTSVTLWRWRKRETNPFPAPFIATNGRNYWRVTDVRAWVAAERGQKLAA